MWLAAIILALAALTGFMAWSLFRRAFRRPASVDPEDEAALQSSRWFAYGPILKPGVRWLREQPWQEVTVSGEDGAELRGRWLPGGGEKPVLLLMHDYGSGPWLDFCLTARWAIRQGWGVLLPAERAHGESGGTYSTLGLLEGGDCLRWAEQEAALAGPERRLVLGGVGLGAAAILSALDRGLPENAAALLLDSAFYSPKAQIRYMLRQRLHMRTFPILQLLSLYARIAWGRGPGSLDGRAALERNEGIPVFFAHGRKDSMTPYDETERAYAACRAPKRLFTGENAGHGGCAFGEAERYYTAWEDFLRKELGERFPLREKTKNHAKRT
ncbi:MAG: hypothetical protein IKG89_02420 [Oscillospiraceae bacterium]|nr:hypothetical protein [Oscillospiraceae bacterium]